MELDADFVDDIRGPLSNLHGWMLHLVILETKGAVLS
jgi:hypothetical protein